MDLRVAYQRLQPISIFRWLQLYGTFSKKTRLELYA
jgi:hypothetical protein